MAGLSPLEVDFLDDRFKIYFPTSSLAILEKQNYA